MAKKRAVEKWWFVDIIISASVAIKFEPLYRSDRNRADFDDL